MHGVQRTSVAPNSGRDEQRSRRQNVLEAQAIAPIEQQYMRQEQRAAEAVRATLRMLRPHAYNNDGFKAVILPPGCKRGLTLNPIAGRTDRQVMDGRVPMCAELAIRCQLRRILTSEPLPSRCEDFREALLRIGPDLFYQLGRCGPDPQASQAAWQVDSAGATHSLLSLAKTPIASEKVVEALKKPTNRTPALLDADNHILRAPDCTGVFDLLCNVVAGDDADCSGPNLAPHFGFFASVALNVVFDLATLGTSDFQQVWNILVPESLFPQALPPPVQEILTEFRAPLARTRENEVLIRTRQEQAEILGNQFEHVAVAYAHFRRYYK